MHKIPDEFINFPEIPTVVVNQEFNPNSANAQSGVAVKQAIDEYDESLVIHSKNIPDGSIGANKLVKNIPYSYLKTPTSLAETVVRTDPVGAICMSTVELDNGYWEELLIDGFLYVNPVEELYFVLQQGVSTTCNVHVSAELLSIEKLENLRFRIYLRKVRGFQYLQLFIFNSASEESSNRPYNYSSPLIEQVLPWASWVSNGEFVFKLLTSEGRLLDWNVYSSIVIYMLKDA